MKTAVITGAGRGIGLALTKELLNGGYKVFASYRTEASAKGLLELARTNQNLTCVIADVTEEKTFAPLKEHLKKAGSVDLLINNSGVIGQSSTPFLELNIAAAIATMDVNTFGPIRMTKMVLPLMNKSGTIAHLTSLMGSIADNGSGGYYDYRMSKCALNMFNKSLSQDFPEMTCLVLHPGWVKTDMGGDKAPTTVDESAKGLYEVIVGKKPRRSGEFRDFKGQELPW